LASLVLVALTATPASGASAGTQSRLLEGLWTYLLETPTSSNPFTGGDPCVRLSGRVLAPFAPFGTTTLSCTVRSGTKVFVTAVSFECSTVEPPPFFGANPAELRACARRNLETYPVHELTVDGRAVRLTRVETRVLQVRLPADNVLGTDQDHALSVGTAWVALLPPLRPGTHVLVIHAAGPDVPTSDNTTTITVRPGSH
jgi:hypothetical protein